MLNLKKVLWLGILLSSLCVSGMSFSAAKKPQDPLITQLETLTTQKENALEGMLEAGIVLQNAPADKNKLVTSWLLQKEGTLPSAFTMQLGTRLFPSNHQEGMRWYLVGRVRSAYNAACCVDPEVAGYAALLGDLYGEEILKYANTHMEEFLSAWEKALIWEKSHLYPPPNPADMCSMGSSPDMLPREDWTSIRAKTLKQSEEVLKKRLTALNKK